LSKSSNDISLEKIINLLSSIHLEHISITGGEPLLHYELKKIIRWLERRCKRLFLLTNGLLLDDDWVRFFLKNRTELFVSINNLSDLSVINYFSNNNTILNIHHVLTENSLEVLCFLNEKLSFFNSIVLLYPVKLNNDLKMYSYDEWKGLINSTKRIFEKNLDKLFFEPAFISKKGTLYKHPRCNSKQVSFIDTSGLIYPCCLLADIIEGETEATNTHCDPSNCPVLGTPMKLPDNVNQICPLIIKSIQSEVVFSPADIK